MYLLDTCVFSEFAKPAPEPRLLAWAETVHESEQHLSTIVLGELLRGAERMPDGARRVRIRDWIESLFVSHRGRLVPIDEDVVRIWAGICADAESLGHPPAAMDSLIAASALSRGLTVVTRNTEDFRYLKVRTFDPWN